MPRYGGTYFDNSAFTLTVTIRWRAFDASGTQLGTAIYIESGIAGKSRVAYESTIFASRVRCSQIARFERFETDARRE